MPENVELEALEQLVACPGWSQFQGMVAKEWGTSEGGGSMFLKAVTDVMRLESAESSAQLRQIITAQREIQKVMQIVPARLALLKRGGVSSGDTIQSRRGAL